MQLEQRSSRIVPMIDRNSQRPTLWLPTSERKEKLSMQRRDFLQSSVAVAGALKVGVAHAQEIVRAHNWDKYDFGSGPRVADRLNQGPSRNILPMPSFRETQL